MNNNNTNNSYTDLNLLSKKNSKRSSKSKSKAKNENKKINWNLINKYTPDNPRRSERIVLLKIKQEELKKESLKNSSNNVNTNKSPNKKTLNKSSLLGKKRQRSLTTPKIKENKNKLIKEKKTPTLKPKKDKKVKNKEPKEIKNNGYFLMNKNTKLSDQDCEEFLKNSKCTNNYCKFIHNYSKLFKEKNNEEFAKRYYSLHQDFQVLAPYERKIFGKTSLDLLLILDITGSMNSYLSKCKTQLVDIIDYIKESNPYNEINVAFVGFRDHGDNNQLVKIDFTTDVDEVKSFISKTYTAGGQGNGGEDVTGGLKTGLDLNWKSEAKYAVFIGDSACHGLKYQSPRNKSYMQYPNGCPKGLVLEDLVAEYAKRNIVFSVFDILFETDVMYKIMNETYAANSKDNKGIEIFKLGDNTADFGFNIGHGASMTLSSVSMEGISIKDFLNDIQKETKAEITNNTVLANKNNDLDNKLTSFLERMNKYVDHEELSKKKSNVSNNNNENNNNKIEIENEKIENNDDSSNTTSTETKEKESIFKLTQNNFDLINIKMENKKDNLDWNNLSTYIFNAKCHSYIIPKGRNNFINWKKPVISRSNISTEVSLSDNPFSEGAMRYAFYMKDRTLDQNLVGKIEKKPNLPSLTIKEDKDVNQQYLENISKDHISLAICKHIAYDFNDRIINKIQNTDNLINFVNSFIYELIDYKNNDSTKPLLNTHQQFISAENYIEGNYTKFNSNTGWISNNSSESSQLAQAFSHFSWQITKGYLMIVDLQGVNNILTDPQIHCLELNKFGKGNLGYVGIMKFFLTHVCNKYCKHLELIHPKKFTNIDINYDFFVEKYNPPVDNSIFGCSYKSIKKMCDLCTLPFTTTENDLYEKKKKGWQSFCNDCDNKRKASFKGATCKNCKKFYKSSAYIYKMRREEFPKFCQKCKIDEFADVRDKQVEEMEGDIEEIEVC